MIQLKDVSKFYSANGITNVGIQNVNLTLRKGEIIAITGESGSGKSTLLNVITKIDTFDEGEIYYKGNATSYFNISDMDDFRKNKVGFIFQNYNILDSYTVLDNVKLPLLLKGMIDSDAEKQALKLLSKVGLSSKTKSRGSKLSGGEKQRCVIARALASDCEILACDEPTGNLDSETAKDIIELIKEVSEDKLVLIVTHNFSEVEGIATRRLKVSDGRIVEDITLKDVLLPRDEIEELNLDYKPIPKKICAKISLSNIKFTPKKTILIALVFLIISFVSFALIQIVYSSITNSYYENNSDNILPNYMTVYDEDAKEVDLKLLEGYDYEVNAFAGELGSNIKFGEDALKYNYEKFFLNNNVLDYELVYGEMPKNENEAIIILPDEYGSYYWYSVYIGQSINGENVEGDSGIKLVGVCKYRDDYCYTYFMSGSKKLSNYLNNIAVNYKLSIKYGDDSYILTAVFDTTKPTGLYLNTNEQGFDFTMESCIINDVYSMDVKKINVYYDEEIKDATFIINPLEDLDIKPYFITLNINPNKANSIKRSLTKKGLKVNYPIVDGENKLMKLLGKVIGFVINLELSTYLIGIFFITYMILSKIFASRIKDYEILRTLGVTKKDMKRIVNYELLSEGFVMMFISLITGYILIYTIKVFKFMRSFSVGALILYLLVMGLFIILMAKRFNKKLFKFSVRKSFEGEEDD